MTDRLISLLSPLVDIGAGATQNDDEKRRVRFTNLVSYIAMFLTSLYLLIYVYFEWWELSVFTAVIIVLYLFVPALNRKALNRISPVYYFFVFMFDVIVVTGLFLGKESGIHYFFFVIPLACLLTISPKDKVWSIIVSVIAVTAFLVIEYMTFSIPCQVDAPSGLLKFFHIMSTTGAMSSLTLFVLLFHSDLRDVKRRLSLEFNRSESLLLNILPKSVASRLKDKQTTIADSHPHISVLFADIVGFTTMAAKRSPEEIVSILNHYFCEYDNLADSFQIEKIKTIGDAYMVAAGVPEPRADHATTIVEFARAMMAATTAISAQLGLDLQIRVGINTGPVTAGVIGVKKFVYDLWGDTVNTASRMESHGIPGKIQITEATYQLVKDRFSFEYRGEIDVKGKGMTKTYILKQ